MPLYEYQCKKCKHRFEKIQKFSDSPVKKCPECGGPVEKRLSAPAVQFKGSGWYVTDYARKGGSTGSGSISAASSSDGEGSTTSTAEKSETSDSKSSDSKKEEKNSTKKAEKSETKAKK